MRLERFDDLATFTALAEPWLLASPGANALALGILGTLRDRPQLYPEPPVLIAVHDGERVVATAVQTPPWPLVLAVGDDAGPLPDLAAGILAVTTAFDGVVGPPEAVEALATGMEHTTGRRARLAVHERAFRLGRVIAPSPANGTWRFANPDDRPLLATWLRDFQAEAVPHDPVPADMVAFLDRWMGDPRRTVYLWEVDGVPVSMAAAGSPTPAGIRIGPVYTPPGWRGRGYASALTAAASQDQLERGRPACFLYTDLSNPTSNHIYQAIGYEPVGDLDHWVFEPAR